MHKTMLAALIIATSVLGIPAFAQAGLGGATRVGAGVNTGADVPHAMHTVDQTGTQAGHTLQRVDHKAKHTAHRASVQTHSTVNDNVNAGGAAGASTADSHAAMNANVNTAASVDAATAAKRARGQSIGADAKVNANADAHGH